jgi:hypothetical protein
VEAVLQVVSPVSPVLDLALETPLADFLAFLDSDLVLVVLPAAFPVFLA